MSNSLQQVQGIEFVPRFVQEYIAWLKHEIGNFQAGIDDRGSRIDDQTLTTFRGRMRQAERSIEAMRGLLNGDASIYRRELAEGNVYIKIPDVSPKAERAARVGNRREASPIDWDSWNK